MTGEVSFVDTAGKYFFFVFVFSDFIYFVDKLITQAFQTADSKYSKMSEKFFAFESDAFIFIATWHK